MFALATYLTNPALSNQPHADRLSHCRPLAVGERPGRQSVRPAIAEIVGWRRDRTASMISDGSMLCR